MRDKTIIPGYIITSTDSNYEHLTKNGVLKCI
jgi:hypothetical protein